jgi:UDP-N-acetyl-D-glucosamine dehydrogenase
MESLLREGLDGPRTSAAGMVFEPGSAGAPAAFGSQGDAASTATPTAIGSVAVVGLGYVGLPTALALHRAGAEVIGVDVSAHRLEAIRNRACDLVPADHERLATALREPKRFRLSAEEAAIGAADAVLVCVPTPVDEHRAPDLTALRAACQAVVRRARAGQTIVLTSTSYVGTTRDLLVEPLTAAGFTVGEDICVAFSPERIDPANTTHPQETVPRVLGAVTPCCADRARNVIEAVAPSVHVVSSPEAAEMTKLYENVFRAVNISLANEMAEAAATLGLSAAEVIDAASTKPYGFMPFQPGPGVGGHCIPCDPHYLLWQLRPHNQAMPLVEGAMAAIAQRPRRVVERAAELLADEVGRGLRGARVLVLGVAYKPGVADVRESPALELLDLLARRGAEVAYHDPLVPVLELGPHAGGHGAPPPGAPTTAPMITVAEPAAADYDLVIAHTLHPQGDYTFLIDCPAVLDCTYRLAGDKVVDL